MFSHFPSAADFIFVASQSFGNIASTSYRMDNASGVHFVLPFGLASFGFGRGRKSQAHFALSLSHDFHVGEKLYGFFLRQAFISATVGTREKAVRFLGSMHCGQCCQFSSFTAKILNLEIQLFYITCVFFTQQFGQHSFCVGSLCKFVQERILNNLTKSML